MSINILTAKFNNKKLPLPAARGPCSSGARASGPFGPWLRRHCQGCLTHIPSTPELVGICKLGIYVRWTTACKASFFQFQFQFYSIQLKQHMKDKDKHRTSKNKSTKLCESHIVKTLHEVKWMKLTTIQSIISILRSYTELNHGEKKSTKGLI